MNSKCS